MKSKEFMEGDDKTVDDVKENHPEIYDFFKKVGVWMAFDKYGKVFTYNTSASHMVVIDIQPSAGLENTKANLEAAGISYDGMTNYLKSEEVIAGEFDNIHWTLGHSGSAENLISRWRFALPHKDDETQHYTDRTMEGVDEGEMPYSELIGKDVTTMKGGIEYRGRVEEIIKHPLNGYKAKAVYYNEPGSYFYKSINDDGTI